MLIDLDKIYLPERLREDYGDDLPGNNDQSFKSLVKGLVKHGQLQDILIRPLDKKEHPEATAGADFVIVDGGRRYLALLALNQADTVARGVPLGKIGATIERTDASDPLYATELEYYANEVRKAFSWQEKAKFIRAVHFGYVDRLRAEEKEWSIPNTAYLLDMSEVTIRRYLELTDDPDIFEDDKVQDARTFVAATKQAKRQKELKKRRKAVAKRAGEEDDPSKTSAAGRERSTVYAGIGDEDIFSLCKQEDCRGWITGFDEGSIDFVHWDPPYGGEQSGGSTSVHERIDDSPEYAEEITLAMLPEIHRVLKEGHWLAIWYHPDRKDWLIESMEAAGFWVNPYPNIWYKRNRKSDGHELKRFLVNAHEEFLFAAKLVDKKTDPILPRNDRQNVFVYDMPVGNARRHIMHKPWDLIREIISVISIDGEIGLDPGVGSGSFFEACVASNRKGYGCELSEEYWLISCDAFKRALEQTSSLTRKEAREIAMAAWADAGKEAEHGAMYVKDHYEVTGLVPTLDDIALALGNTS